MSLLEAVVDGEEELAVLRQAARARWKYLSRRAEALAEPGSADTLPEEAMLVASLWMEACETAAFMGEPSDARTALRGAALSLSAVGNPFGESLRVAFLQGGFADAPLLGAVRISAAEPEGSPQAWARFNRQQARVAEGADPPADADLHGAMQADVRVGRLGWSPSAMLALPHGPRAEREAFVATALLQQWDALQRARRNAYLWREMLAPVALFDLELAVLIRHALAGRASGELPGALGAVLGDGPRRGFAVAYLDTVDALREPGLGEDWRRVLQGQR